MKRLFRSLFLLALLAAFSSCDPNPVDPVEEYDDMQAKVEEDKAALKATAEELTLLTMKRIERDSIRTQFETLGAKIRYIHMKQKE